VAGPSRDAYRGRQCRRRHTARLRHALDARRRPKRPGRGDAHRRARAHEAAAVRRPDARRSYAELWQLAAHTAAGRKTPECRSRDTIRDACGLAGLTRRAHSSILTVPAPGGGWTRHHEASSGSEASGVGPGASRDCAIRGRRVCARPATTPSRVVPARRPAVVSCRETCAAGYSCLPASNEEVRPDVNDRRYAPGHARNGDALEEEAMEVTVTICACRREY
jgi:hypothetical protein